MMSPSYMIAAAATGACQPAQGGHLNMDIPGNGENEGNDENKHGHGIPADPPDPNPAGGNKPRTDIKDKGEGGQTDEERRIEDNKGALS